MKPKFKDPCEVKVGKEIKSPWNFEAPCYDERSSCFVNAGTYYGVGKAQPVGHSDGARSNFSPTERIKEISLKNYGKETEVR
jgi:hypothetical protein